MDSSQDDVPDAQPYPEDSRDGNVNRTQIANDFADSDGEQDDRLQPQLVDLWLADGRSPSTAADLEKHGASNGRKKITKQEVIETFQGTAKSFNKLADGFKPGQVDELAVVKALDEWATSEE